ncbi:MAG: hypothetical protein V7642_5797 [Burkholderiales bacterium]|jgi:hypothetical protein
MLDADTEQWLRTLPVDEPSSVGGVEVWLTVSPAGAELGACLIPVCADAQLADALKQGFRSAIDFDAGFSLSPDGKSLCLTQWLSNVYGWLEAAEPLEKLLNQVDMLHAALDPTRSALIRNPAIARIEQRLRMSLAGRIT